LDDETSGSIQSNSRYVFFLKLYPRSWQHV
jgi:hypothetical protein